MKKIHIKNTPTFFYNKDFQTIMIQVIFPFPREEEKLAFQNLLPGMLNSVSKKYPTEREFSKELQKLYILGAFCSSTSIMDYGYFTFHFMIPDVYSLNKNLLEEQFQFFSQMIYGPKVKDNHFFEEELTREIENLKVYIEKSKKDTNSYAVIRGKEIVDPNGRFSSSIHNHTDLIDQVNPSNMYEYYQETIYENQPLIYVFGNVEEKEITELCQKYLYRKEFGEKDILLETKHYLPVFSDVKDVVEESDFRNSVYLSFYKVKDMSLEDEVLLDVVKGLLSSLSSRLLNKKLRDENDLVYSSQAVTFNSYGLLGIFTFIHSDNISIVREKVKEVLEDLKDEEMIAPLLQNIKERNRVSLIRILDDKTGLFQDAVIEDLGIDFTAKEYYEKLVKVTPHDVACFMDRLVLDTHYFLKEGEHE